MAKAILVEKIKSLRGKDRTKNEILNLIETGKLETIELEEL